MAGAKQELTDASSATISTMPDTELNSQSSLSISPASLCAGITTEIIRILGEDKLVIRDIPALKSCKRADKSCDLKPQVTSVLDATYGKAVLEGVEVDVLVYQHCVVYELPEPLPGYEENRGRSR